MWKHVFKTEKNCPFLKYISNVLQISRIGRRDNKLDDYGGA